MLPARLAPERFAAAIACRLDCVVPQGLAVRANGIAVAVFDPTWWGDSLIAGVVAEEDGRSIVERVETAALAIMSAAQDAVTESTKQQWPIGPSGVGMPEARVVGGELRMWFGDKDVPVLRLESLNLLDLADGAA